MNLEEEEETGSSIRGVEGEPQSPASLRSKGEKDNEVASRSGAESCPECRREPPGSLPRRASPEPARNSRESKNSSFVDRRLQGPVSESELGARRRQQARGRAGSSHDYQSCANIVVLTGSEDWFIFPQEPQARCAGSF